MRIGFCNGCFDKFHNGHRHFLEEAHRHCDYLIVAVNSDESVRLLKGEGRPVETLEVRIRHINDHGAACAVIPFDGDEKPLIRAIDPDILIKGQEYARSLYWNDYTRAGGHIVWVPRLPGLSTSQQLEEASR